MMCGITGTPGTGKSAVGNELPDEGISGYPSHRHGRAVCYRC